METLGGIFGIGGGLIALPILILVFGRAQQLARGTDLVMVVPNVLLALWKYNPPIRIAVKHITPSHDFRSSFRVDGINRCRRP